MLILIITAEDHGSPENTGSVTMTITLLDENDNPPTFVPPFGYAVVTPEDEPVGSVLLVPVSGYVHHHYICHLHTLLQAATDPDLFGGGQISFRKATSSPLSKLSCFSVNRCSHYPMHIVTDVCMLEGTGPVCPLSYSLHRVPYLMLLYVSLPAALLVPSDWRTVWTVRLTLSFHSQLVHMTMESPVRTSTIAGTHFTLCSVQVWSQALQSRSQSLMSMTTLPSSLGRPTLPLSLSSTHWEHQLLQYIDHTHLVAAVNSDTFTFTGGS